MSIPTRAGYPNRLVLLRTHYPFYATSGEQPAVRILQACAIQEACARLQSVPAPDRTVFVTAAAAVEAMAQKNPERNKVIYKTYVANAYNYRKIIEDFGIHPAMGGWAIEQ